MFKIEPDSIYSKSLYPFDLNQKKENAVWQSGNISRELHNRVSAYVFENLEFVFENINSAFAFTTYMRNLAKQPEHEHLYVCQAAMQSSIYEEVFTCYINKLAAVKDSFYYHPLTNEPDYDKFKRVIGYKKGTPTDIHNLANDMKYYVLKPCMTYDQYIVKLDKRLAGARKDVNKKDNTAEETSNALKKFERLCLYKDIANRLGQKIWNLVYNRILNKMKKEPVFFRTRNFETACRTKFILNHNDNKRSVIPVFTIVTLPTRKQMYMPLKYSTAYHGAIEHYNHEVTVNERGTEVVKNNYYTMMFVFDYNDISYEEVKWETVNKERVHRYKQSLNLPSVYKAVDKNFEDSAKEWKDKGFHIVLAYKGDRQLAVVDDSTPLLGIDCNTSRMLLAVSDETVYGGEKFDRLKYFVSKKIDYQRKYRNAQNMNSRGRYLHSLKKYERKVDGMLHEIMVDMLQGHTSYKKNRKYEDGVRVQHDTVSELHIVMEELIDSFGQTHGEQVLDKKRPNKKYNTNDVTHGLKLSTIKDEMKSIGNTYNVGTSFVPSEYTSRICPVCGCHLKKNRNSQDKFKCDHCGYTADADINAAQNIKEFKNSDVLGSRLLALDGTGCGTYKTKPSLSHWQIKNIVSEYCNEQMREFDLRQMSNDLQTNRGNFV